MKNEYSGHMQDRKLHFSFRLFFLALCALTKCFDFAALIVFTLLYQAMVRSSLGWILPEHCACLLDAAPIVRKQSRFQTSIGFHNEFGEIGSPFHFKKISLMDSKFKQYIFAIKSAIHQEQNILPSAF